MNAPAKGYAITLDGHGTFTPDGRADQVNVADHNAQVEAEELRVWAERPERWQVYVADKPRSRQFGEPDNPPLILSVPYRVNRCAVEIGAPVTTWLGTVLGRITYARTFRHNFGSRMTCIRVQGTNGATYYGRFGSDWSELCRVRKVRS